MTKATDKKLLDAIEKVLTDIMADKKATAKEKLDAAEKATKLMLMKHKISDNSEEDKKHFFNT